jgi:putative redox protein
MQSRPVEFSGARGERLSGRLELPDIAAVAVLGAPFQVEQVTKLLGGGLQEILERGEAVADLGGRPFTVRRAFVEDLRAQDQGRRIGALRRPLLILHSPADRIVGIDNATGIFKAARHPKSFVALDGADHLLTRPADADYAAEVIVAWASRYLGVRAEAAERPVAAGVIVSDTGRGLFQVQVQAGGAVFDADEPVEAGGLGSGPTPYDLLSAGLGACTAMTLKLYAEQKAWPLAHVQVVVGHVKREDEPPPDLFTREIVLEGELTEDQRARLLEVAGRCPVHRTLERGSAVTTLAGERPVPVVSDAPAQHALDAETACVES